MTSAPDAGREAAGRPSAGLAGQRATVMGLGLVGGGVAAARFLARHGARVTVTDRRDARTLRPSLERLAGVDLRLVLGGHERRDFEQADLVVANPAVPPGHELLERARACGARVTSDVALFFEHARCPWAGVTGTAGKSSTATFTGTLLERSGAVSGRVLVAGNVGVGLLDWADRLGPGDVLVAELSSYQLEHLAREGIVPRCPAAAVAVTNVEPDHLTRHGSLAAYREAKRALVELAAPDAAVLVPAGDPELARWDLGGRRRVRVSAGGPAAELCIEAGRFQWPPDTLGHVRDLAVPGGFQRANALFALGLAHVLGAPAERLAASVGALRAPPHRLEDLGPWLGVRVFDNAIATTPDATAAALDSLPGPLVLVAGGLDKGLDWSGVAERLARSGSRAIAFGQDAPAIAPELARAGAGVQIEPRLEDAIRAGLAQARALGTLLFSPGAASFDAFPNVLARARAFRSSLQAAAGSLEAARGVEAT